MRNDWLWFFLKIIGWQRVISFGYHQLEEAPRPSRELTERGEVIARQGIDVGIRGGET